MNELDAAVGTACGTPIVTGWVLVAEVINDAGTRNIQIIQSQQSTAWERIGLLSVGLARAHARLKGQA